MNVFLNIFHRGKEASYLIKKQYYRKRGFELNLCQIADVKLPVSDYISWVIHFTYSIRNMAFQYFIYNA
jgi:hypothetical protein